MSYNFTYEKALDALGFDPSKRADQYPSEAEIKKKYYKLALKYHPDKNKNKNLSPEEQKKYSDKFKKINAAYIFLREGGDKHNNLWEANEDMDTDYISILKRCINFLYPSNNWDDLYIQTTINGFMMNCQDVSLDIFRNMEKERCCELYELLANYFIMFDMPNKDILEKMRLICQEKMKNDNIIVLTPSISDLMEDKVYKLKVGSEEFYIPLWHNKLYYDLSKNDLIVMIKPDLPPNIYIDKRNNIIIQTEVDIASVFKKGIFSYIFEGKKLEVESSKITLTKELQVFTFRRCGIAIKDTENIFSNKYRGDIFIHLKLISRNNNN